MCFYLTLNFVVCVFLYFWNKHRPGTLCLLNEWRERMNVWGRMCGSVNEHVSTSIDTCGLMATLVLCDFHVGCCYTCCPYLPRFLQVSAAGWMVASPSFPGFFLLLFSECWLFLKVYSQTSLFNVSAFKDLICFEGFSYHLYVAGIKMPLLSGLIVLDFLLVKEMLCWLFTSKLAMFCLKQAASVAGVCIFMVSELRLLDAGNANLTPLFFTQSTCYVPLNGKPHMLHLHKLLFLFPNFYFLLSSPDISWLRSPLRSYTSSLKSTLDIPQSVRKKRWQFLHIDIFEIFCYLDFKV